MKKPNIEIKEFGAMGPDGYEVVINGKHRYAVRTESEAKSIIGMIDALIDSDNSMWEAYLKIGIHELEQLLDDTMEANYKALKKAGVEL